jgi:hypothetical protein
MVCWKWMSTLTSPQEQVLAQISAGSTISCAAQTAGVHRNTIHNWLRSAPAFRLALADAREAKAHYWREQAEEQAAAAIDTIRAIMTEPSLPAGVRLKAALSILNLAIAPPLQHPHDSAPAIPDRPADPGPPAGRQPELVHNCAPAIRRDAPKIGRNDICPCGSGRKFKHCCLGKAAGASSSATLPVRADLNGLPASFSS